MTSGRNPRRRPRASARQLRQRYDRLSQYLSTGAAIRMAPHMPLNSPRTRRIMRIMKRRTDERYEQLINESRWDPEGGGPVLGAAGPGAYIHPVLGVIDYQVAIDNNTAQVERVLYGGVPINDAYDDLEPELRSITSP